MSNEILEFGGIIVEGGRYSNPRSRESREGKRRPNWVVVFALALSGQGRSQLSEAGAGRTWQK